MLPGPLTNNIWAASEVNVEKNVACSLLEDDNYKMKVYKNIVLFAKPVIFQL